VAAQRLDIGRGLALGVDWSGAKNAHRKIWAAWLRCEGNHGAVERLERPFVVRLRRPFGKSTISAIAEDFTRWLTSCEYDVAGLDFCFGLAADQMKRLALPTTGPVAVGRSLRSAYPDADGFASAAAPESARETDTASHSPFRPTNLRMWRQTYWGLRALGGLDPGQPTPPWSVGERAIIEILPANVLRRLGTSTKLTTDGRRNALAALERRGINLCPSKRDEIVCDKHGDALDAVLAAVAAACARQQNFSGDSPHASTSGEGWIYSF
jgi:Protein of unknown function (DUF429)